MFLPALPNWRQVVLVVVPLLLMPLAMGSEALKCAYVTLVMAIFWMTEVVPISITALIPVFAFPLLGVVSTKAITLIYMKETNMLFLGGLTVASAVEFSGLHKRIALFVILTIGPSPRRLMTSFMLTTMCLSMWITNTASTAMMVPIVTAVMNELDNTRAQKAKVEFEVEAKNSHQVPRDNEICLESEDVEVRLPHKNGRLENKDKSTDNEDLADAVLFAQPPDEDCRNIRDMCYLATAYGANLGGTGCITGTGSNMVLRALMERYFPESTEINFATWMAYNVPGMLLCFVLGWAWLQLLFMGFRSNNELDNNKEVDEKIHKLLRDKYRALGKMSFHETVVLSLFISLVLLWLFRSPGFVTGWGDLFEILHPNTKIADATPVMVIAFLLFIIPRNPSLQRRPNQDKNTVEYSESACLTWQVVNDKMPWDIVLLLGGGFALAEASERSGMSVLISQQLEYLKVFPKEIIALIVVTLTAIVTEAASNVATASVLLPVLKELSLSIKVNPIYFIMSVTLATSYAFMLPVATAPNAIVLGAARMKSITMVKAGLVMNFLCIGVNMLMINTLGVYMFDLHTFPTWANATITAS